MIQGAIFDADGTLLDSMGMWDTVGERYLASLGIPARPGLREILFPMSLTQCAAYLKQTYGLPQSCQAIADGINESIFTFYRDEVQAKAGAKAFLEALHRQGVAVTLATATDREVILAGLRRTSLLPLLDKVFTCGDLGVDKRAPPPSSTRPGRPWERPWQTPGFLRMPCTLLRRPIRRATAWPVWQTLTVTRKRCRPRATSTCPISRIFPGFMREPNSGNWKLPHPIWVGQFL